MNLVAAEGASKERLLLEMGATLMSAETEN
jgi:hypothetical protein